MYLKKISIYCHWTLALPVLGLPCKEFNTKTQAALLTAVVLLTPVLSAPIGVAAAERIVTEPRSLVALGIALISVGRITRRLLQKLLGQKEKRAVSGISTAPNRP
jgi:hypothetical protein